MNEDVLKQLIEEAVRNGNTEILWKQLPVILVVAVTAVTGFLSSYFGYYAKRKAENLATREDFEQILAQNRETIKVTEEIKSEIFRRSSLRDKVLLERYQLVNDINERLEMVRQDYERIKKGQQTRTDIRDGETLLLTEVHTILELKRWILTPSFYDPLMERFNLVRTLWEYEYNGEEWKYKMEQWNTYNNDIQSQLQSLFDL